MLRASNFRLSSREVSFCFFEMIHPGVDLKDLRLVTKLVFHKAV